MSDVNINGVPVPDWLQGIRQGDPIEVTIRGTLQDVFTDIANGPEHLVLEIQYGNPKLHPLGRGLHITVPCELGVSIKSFELVPTAH